MSADAGEQLSHYRCIAFPGVTLSVMVTQIGHDNWIHALVFHPCGKYLLSASDDKTVKVWDLAQGRCIKTIEAPERFVTCMTWGRALIGGAAPVSEEGKGGDGKVNGVAEPRRINVIATGSVDFTVKVSRLSGSDFLICPWLIDHCLDSDMDAVMVAHQNRITPEGQWQDETSTCKPHVPGVTDYDFIDDTCCACHDIHDGLWQGKSLGVNAAPRRSIVYMSDRAVSSRYKRSVPS
jgi:WD40 repeat protein